MKKGQFLKITSNERMAIYKEEIRRAYRVLGADIGIQQNAIDIQLWRNYGFITAEEYHYLRCYSRSIFVVMDNIGNV